MNPIKLTLLARGTGTIKIKTMIIDFKTGRPFDLVHHCIDFDTLVIDYFSTLRTDNMRVRIRLLAVIAVAAQAEFQLQGLAHCLGN